MRQPDAVEHAAAFADSLQAWFDAAMRPLPWRKDYSPYGVWISEIMLQQTQMERGVAYYTRWMRRFPDVRAVAEADFEDILAAWEGLGYYSRARNLHAAAKHVMDEHGGVFPDSPDAIRRLPGVGDYTAGAIASIAFNLPVPAVDANVLRVFARILDIDRPVSDPGVRDLVAGTVRALMPADSPRRFNQALMELGALVCGKKAKCGECPLRRLCRAFANGTVAARPAATEKRGCREATAVAVMFAEGGRVFVRKRPPHGLWAGMWEFPGGEAADGEAPEAAVARLVRETTGAEAMAVEKIAVVRHSYTTNRVTLHGYLCRPRPGASPACPGMETRWIAPEDTAALAFPAGQRKLLDRAFPRRKENMAAPE